MSHPILEELAQQLPESTTTFRHISEKRSFTDIVQQARLEFSWLGNTEASAESSACLEANGYADWLKDAEDDDRTRCMGALKLIIELAEDLDED